MKKLVPESLNESINEEPKKVKQSLEEKAKQAIASLKKQLEDAKKGGSFKTTIEKRVKIKEIEDKIKSWEEKIK